MSNMPQISNNNLALFVAIGVAVFGGFSLGRSSDDDSAEKTSQVESEEGDSEGEESAEETRGTRGSGSRSSRSEGESRDARLVGDWRHTETYSGEWGSMVIDHFMTINADGTMEAWDGGAAGSVGDMPWEPERSDERVRCEWRTKDNVLEIRGEGRDWTPLAEFEVSAESLLTVSSGERQIWERI